ncbi:MAG: hypothetical protein D6806_15855 [Deltaproteobacteria bacterium]|nr:MAG: hypothetical protein D6806_15855 [Deltaproteobacteria bacterium]
MIDLLRAIANWFSDLLENTRDLFLDFAHDFKKGGRPFRMKVAMVGSYVAICLATVVVFVPPGELNEIDAEVVESVSSLIGGRYFRVINRSDETWHDVVLVINGEYYTSWPRIRPGEKRAFYLSSFRSKRGKRASQQLAVRTLRIECKQGAFERRYGPR